MQFIPLAIGAGTSLLQAGQQREAGQIQQEEFELVAKQEELGAVQRETDRKRRLSEALSSQVASAGARGIAAFEGSPLTILQEDIKTERVATQRDKFNARLAAMTARARGEVAATGAQTRSLLGVAQDVPDIAGAFPAGGKTALTRPTTRPVGSRGPR